MARLIILDRDGVINQDSDNYIRTVEQFIPIPGSLKAIADLKQRGFTVAVATNQSGIARGYYSIETLELMHQKLLKLLQPLGGTIDLIKQCPHGPDDGCKCRKPLPGLLQQIGKELSFKLAEVPVIGDSLRDLESALAVGATPILVRTGKGQRTISKGVGLDGVPIYDDLAAAVANLN